MKVQVIVGMVVIFLFHLTSAQTNICKHDNECGVGQCCYIKPEFEVVSRRQLQPIHLPISSSFGHRHNDTGVCENYHLPGERCSPFETMNKHCGCRSGTTCQWVSTATTTGTHRGRDLEKRKMAWHAGPGSYLCA